MTFPDSPTFSPVGGPVFNARAETPYTVRIRRLRLVIGAAAVFALVALAALGEGGARHGSDVQADTTVSQTGPDFDGRGKWGGYAR